MKRLIAMCGVMTLLLGSVSALEDPVVEVGSAVLMEQETGTLLYESNGYQKFEPASVTKVMTLLLVMEAVDQGRISMEDTVTVSAYAAGMGGSQVYLKEGEQMSVYDMIKAVAVVSGNDAAVALAEHLAGSELAFVGLMNQRAAELGMEDTCFLNCTGLPEAGHLTTAYDIALMSRELMTHEGIQEFTTIWMDSIRDGAFQLSNTNKLVRYYEGTTGLKTGFTDSALYCLSATAQRDGLDLIAVVMKAPSSDVRFETAKTLLNFGFANYTLYTAYPDRALPPVTVSLGASETVQPILADSSQMLVEKSQLDLIETEIQLVESVEAPVEQGQKLGELTVRIDGITQQVIPLVADTGVERLSFTGILGQLLEKLFMAG